MSKKIWSAPVALVVVLTMALFFGGITVSADEVDSGNCGESATWSLDNNGTLTISGTGEMYDYTWQDTRPWNDSSVTKIVIGEGITGVGNNAFRYMENVTSITFPSSLTSFGDYSFSQTGITELTVPAGIKSLGAGTFNYCTQLEKVTIPSNTALTTIPDGAFCSCAKLTTVIMPDKITSIGEDAFREDITLELSALPANLKTIGRAAFYGCRSLETLNLGSKLEDIGGNAFCECENLQSVTFPNTLKTIGYWAFRETGLTSLSLPSGVTSIGELAFNQCNNLTTIDLSFSGDITIGDSAFSTCEKVESITLKGNITALSNYIFSSNPALTSVSVPDTVTSIGDGAFAGCVALKSFNWPSGLTSVGKGAFNRSGLTAVTIPANVAFGESAFYNCENLSQVTFENGVTSISKEMFNNCSSLKTVTLPESLTTIGEGAFKYSGLTAIDIPAGVKVLSERAFSDCHKLERITLHEGLEKLGNYAFEWCEKVTSIEIPSSCTSIGNRALACTHLESVTLTINDDDKLSPTELFSGCNFLESVTIKGNMTKIPYGMFSGCGSLKTIELPDTITEIGRQAFSYCNSLTNFTIPANVTSIGEEAFRNCISLTALTIPSKVESIENNAFSGSGLTSIVIPDTVTTLGSYMFAECRSLSSVTLPSHMTVIPEYFFSYCYGLKTYSIPSHITGIDSYAFSGSGLTSITIPGTVKTIDASAFEDCDSLLYVEIGEGVETVKNDAFTRCNLIETVVIGSTVTDLDAYAFRYCKNIKTIYCTAAQKQVLESNHPDAEFIIIGNVSNLKTPHLIGHSITLSADIGMNFFIKLPEEYNANNTTVEFTWGEGTDYNTNKSYVHNVKGTLVPVAQHGANYVVTCGVTARAMTDKITMVVKNGTTEILRDEYTIIDYMNTLMASNADYSVKNLVFAMAYYGSGTQDYFRYKEGYDPISMLDTSSMWNDPVINYKNDIIDNYTVDEANMTIRNINGCGLSYYGTSVLCTSQMKLRFYFEVTDEASFQAISGTASLKGVSLKFAEKKVNGQDLVYLETQGLAPGELEQVFELSIGGSVYKYDFKDYIVRVGSVDPRFVDTAKYAYAFSHFANVYKTGAYYV